MPHPVLCVGQDGTSYYSTCTLYKAKWDFPRSVWLSHVSTISLSQSLKLDSWRKENVSLHTCTTVKSYVRTPKRNSILWNNGYIHISIWRYYRILQILITGDDDTWDDDDVSSFGGRPALDVKELIKSLTCLQLNAWYKASWTANGDKMNFDKGFNARQEKI